VRAGSVLPLLLVAACGGGNAAGKGAGGASDDDDHGFRDYAAEHGITALSGGDAPEVTADGLRLELLQKDKPVKLDGVLLEWPAPVKAGVVVKGDGAKTGLKISLQYDDAKLYVGADVTDASFAAGQDHVELVMAVPQPGGGRTLYELYLYAGKPGESEGSVRFGRRGNVAGAKIVESTTNTGYQLEASIPWSSIPDARLVHVGIRGVARYVDGENIVATGPGDAQHPAAMTWVPSEPELSLIEQVLTPKGLTKTAPSAEIIADLAGDGTRERVAVYEQILTICGTSYLGGTGYFFRDLGGDLVKLDVRDVTGNGKEDVIVRRRAHVGETFRDYLEVMSAASATEEPKIVFGHEIVITQGDKHIDNALRIARGLIEVSVEPATAWDALTYHEPIAGDIEPILFPWGAVRSQTFKWDGTHFAKSGEVAQKSTVPVVADGATPDHPPPVHPAEPPTPKVATGGDLSAQVFAQYKKDRGLGADASPKVDLKVQVSGDKRPERAVLVGRDIVVFGPGYKGGTGYSVLTLQQFVDAGDVSDMTARDLTGDGAADLVVRGVRHASADGGSVDTESMFVYQVTADAITRVFGIETAREQGGKRIQGMVQFVPAAGGKTFDVLAQPGRATGWTEKTYPWSQDQPGSGTIEPLLLPWGGVSSVRYSWNGSTFAKP
jgi:hypothetical protein